VRAGEVGSEGRDLRSEIAGLWPSVAAAKHGRTGRRRTALFDARRGSRRVAAPSSANQDQTPPSRVRSGGRSPRAACRTWGRPSSSSLAENPPKVLILIKDDSIKLRRTRIDF